MASLTTLPQKAVAMLDRSRSPLLRRDSSSVRPQVQGAPTTARPGLARGQAPRWSRRFSPKRIDLHLDVGLCWTTAPTCGSSSILTEPEARWV